ncbi:MAG TPA: PAS domain S-box protein, partial [Chitinophagaceae bacterium]
GKKTEREMTRIYQENEVTLNRINDALISIDNNWRYTFLNDAALPTHVLGKEGTIGKSLWEVHPELEGTIFGKKYREAMTTMKVLEVDDYYPPMDTWFSVKMYPSADGLTIFYRNVTEQKKAEQRLLQTLKEVSDYKYALDESSIVAITDQKGIIKHANNNFCRISKYSREELIGQDHRIINSGYHSEEFIRDLWVTIANGKIWKGELKNEAKDGSIYWVDTTIIPFLNENDKPYQYVAIRSDITERKKTEENLEKSELRLKEIINDLLQKNKNHEQFAQIVSHNLRAPVANIIGFSNVLQRSGLDDTVKMKFIQGLFSASNRLDTVIKDLTHILQVSREISENKQTVCLSDMVHDVRASISNMVEKEKAEIHYEFTTDEINTIKTYLYSIFYNLISNSIKFRRPSVNPVIEIKGYKKGDFFQISFRDNGLGIDIHNKPDEIFGFYKRFHDHIEGKGLGLFMTKTQVESMGGSITVNSKLNEGTEFVIALPA